MSIQAVAWVLEHSESKLGDRCVIISIANHTDKYGRFARPSVRTIAEESNMHERNVQRCLQSLEEMGEIEVVGEWQNDRGKPTKVWNLAKMPKPDNLSGDIIGEARFKPTSSDYQTNCQVIEEGANSGQIVTLITGQIRRDNVTNPTPLPDKSDIALKEGAVHKAVHKPSSSSSSEEETARRCFETLRELPACRNASGARPSSVTELIGEHPDLNAADWIDFSRWCRDTYSAMDRWGGANTTWSESPAKLMRDQIHKWKAKHRPPPVQKPEDLPSVAAVVVEDAPRRAIVSIEDADCMCWSGFQKRWLPGNREVAIARRMEVRDITDDDRTEHSSSNRSNDLKIPGEGGDMINRGLKKASEVAS